MIRLPIWLVALFALGFLLGLATTALAGETKGQITTVFADQDEFLVEDMNRVEHKFQLGENSTIVINDEEKTLEDLQEGDEVTVTWTDIDGTMVVVCIEGRRDGGN